jgi:hypothetical protein
MSTPKLNNHTIEALRNLIDRIAELIFEDVKNYVVNDLSACRQKPNTVRLRKIAKETALLNDLSVSDWEALLAAALPQVKERIDEDDVIISAQAQGLIDGLPEEEPESSSDKLIQHRVNQAATELQRLVRKGEQTTLENVADALSDRHNVGSGPYQGFWHDFVREHRDQIKDRFIFKLVEIQENVEEMFSPDTDSGNDDDSQDDREEMLSMGVGHLVETQGLSQRVHNVLQELEAKVLADVVVHDPSQLKSLHGFGQKSLEELETALSEYGLELGMDISESERDRFRSLYRIKTLLRMPVAELDLSVRTHNCFKAANIDTVGELIEHEEDDLLEYRNFSHKSLEEVIEVLDERGLQLGMDVDPYLQGEGEH